jgi:hypothetical protein
MQKATGTSTPYVLSGNRRFLHYLSFLVLPRLPPFFILCICRLATKQQKKQKEATSPYFFNSIVI